MPNIPVKPLPKGTPRWKIKEVNEYYNSQMRAILITGGVLLVTLFAFVTAMIVLCS